MSRFLPSLWGNKLSSLSKKSDSLFRTFTKVQSDCIKTNKEIEKVVESKTKQINSLQSEVSTLTNLSTKNTKLHDKIGTFIND